MQVFVGRGDPSLDIHCEKDMLASVPGQHKQIFKYDRNKNSPNVVMILVRQLKAINMSNQPANLTAQALRL